MVTMETLFLDLASSVVLALALGILALIITMAAHVMLTEIPTTLFASVHLVIQVRKMYNIVYKAIFERWGLKMCPVTGKP